MQSLFFANPAARERTLGLVAELLWFRRSKRKPASVLPRKPASVSNRTFLTFTFRISKFPMKQASLSMLAFFAMMLSHSATCSAQSDYSFEFMDDFFKPRHSYRNPFEERIETERHDFTQSTTTVGYGVAQLEGGYSYFYKDHDDEIEHTHVAPEMLLRLGLSEDIEFRLRFNYAWRFIDVADHEDGAQDLIWSFKLGMTEQCGYRPESALELRFSAPSGADIFSTQRVDHGIDYIYGWELAEFWELSGSTGYGTGGLDDIGLIPSEPAEDWFIVWNQSVALGAELTENITLYHEFYGLFSHALQDNFNIVVYNIGVDYFVTDDFVLDLRFGKGLTDDADDFFAGFGGGVRF